MRKGDQTRNFCISQFQGWLCYVKFITDCISVHSVNWRPLSQIHIYTLQAQYTSHPPDSISWDAHTAVTVGLFHWPNTSLCPALFLQRNLWLAYHPSARRVWNVTQRTRHSRDRMIRLLAHPLTPSPVSKIDQRQTGRRRKRDNLLTSDSGKGVGKEPNDTSTRKPFPLYIHSILSAFDVQESRMSPSLGYCAYDIKNDETEYMCTYLYCK
jgi:hypothetical protein